MFKFWAEEKSEMKEIRKEINLNVIDNCSFDDNDPIFFLFISFFSLSFALFNLSTFPACKP